jgi:hypothetical protein
MRTAKIISITKDNLIETGERFLDIKFGIYKDGEFEKEIRLAFTMSMTTEEIENEIKKYCETMNSDEENAIKNAKVVEEDKVADKTIIELTNKEISL